MAMSEDDVLKQVIEELAYDDPERNNIKAVHRRIKYLLPKAATATELSYDESIAAYLFCLSRVDLAVARDASHLVLMTGGLWWSVQLALHIKDKENDKWEAVASIPLEEQKSESL